MNQIQGKPLPTSPISVSSTGTASDTTAAAGTRSDSYDGTPAGYTSVAIMACPHPLSSTSPLPPPTDDPVLVQLGNQFFDTYEAIEASPGNADFPQKTLGWLADCCNQGDSAKALASCVTLIRLAQELGDGFVQATNRDDMISMQQNVPLPPLYAAQYCLATALGQHPLAAQACSRALAEGMTWPQLHTQAILFAGRVSDSTQLTKMLRAKAPGETSATSDALTTPHLAALSHALELQGQTFSVQQLAELLGASPSTRQPPREAKAEPAAQNPAGSQPTQAVSRGQSAPIHAAATLTRAAPTVDGTLSLMAHSARALHFINACKGATAAERSLTWLMQTCNEGKYEQALQDCVTCVLMATRGRATLRTNDMRITSHVDKERWLQALYAAQMCIALALGRGGLAARTPTLACGYGLLTDFQREVILFAARLNDESVLQTLLSASKLVITDTEYSPWRTPKERIELAQKLQARGDVAGARRLQLAAYPPETMGSSPAAQIWRGYVDFLCGDMRSCVASLNVLDDKSIAHRGLPLLLRASALLALREYDRSRADTVEAIGLLESLDPKKLQEQMLNGFYWGSKPNTFRLTFQYSLDYIFQNFVAQDSLELQARCIGFLGRLGLPSAACQTLADQATDDGHHHAAALCLGMAHALEPRNVALRMRYAEAKLALSQYVDAMDIIWGAGEPHTLEPKALQFVATTLLDVASRAQEHINDEFAGWLAPTTYRRRAARTLQLLIEKEAGNVEARINLADLYRQAGKPMLAKKYMEQVCTLSTNSVPHRLLLADDCCQAGLASNAIAALGDALDAIARDGDPVSALSLWSTSAAKAADLVARQLADRMASPEDALKLQEALAVPLTDLLQARQLHTTLADLQAPPATHVPSAVAASEAPTGKPVAIGLTPAAVIAQLFTPAAASPQASRLSVAAAAKAMAAEQGWAATDQWLTGLPLSQASRRDVFHARLEIMKDEPQRLAAIFNQGREQGLVSVAFSYNRMLRANVEDLSATNDLLKQMRKAGIEPDGFTRALRYESWVNAGEVAKAQAYFETHAHSAKSIKVAIAFLRPLLNQGLIDEACAYFQTLAARGIKADASAYRVMIAGLYKHRYFHIAREMQKQAESEGLTLYQSSSQRVTKAVGESALSISPGPPLSSLLPMALQALNVPLVASTTTGLTFNDVIEAIHRECVGELFLAGESARRLIEASTQQTDSVGAPAPYHIVSVIFAGEPAAYLDTLRRLARNDRTGLLLRALDKQRRRAAKTGQVLLQGPSGEQLSIRSTQDAQGHYAVALDQDVQLINDFSAYGAVIDLAQGAIVEVVSGARTAIAQGIFERRGPLPVDSAEWLMEACARIAVLPAQNAAPAAPVRFLSEVDRANASAGLEKFAQNSAKVEQTLARLAPNHIKTPLELCLWQYRFIAAVEAQGLLDEIILLCGFHQSRCRFAAKFAATHGFAQDPQWSEANIAEVF